MGEMRQFIGNLEVPGLDTAFNITEEMLRDIADQYLYAAQMAGETYRRIEAEKGKGNFIIEVSMDEGPNPQTPLELFFIPAMLAHYNVPAQTIAPKFTGRFNKGVDYVGDINHLRLKGH